MIRSGRRIVFDTFRQHGVEYVFGNPGTSELPFLEELTAHSDLTYIMGLMEAAVVTMADGYAHLSGKVGVINLHIAPGLGNAIGSLYNAREKQTPLLVTAGQTDTRMRLREPLTSGDLVAMAAPVTKWSVQAETVEELPLLLNRAFKVAQDAPSGPVFVSLPINVMDGEGMEGPIPPSAIHRRSPPEAAAIEAAARILIEARNPLIIAGDRVARAGANKALVRIAEQLGAPVWLETLPAHISFPVRHPLFRGRVPQDQALIAEAVGGADAVLLVGGEFFEETWYSPAPVWPSGTRVIHADPAVAKVGANYRVDVGIVADPALFLDALCAALSEKVNVDMAERARRRLDAAKALKVENDQAFLARLEDDTGEGRMSPARMLAELARATPSEAMVTAEIFSNVQHLFRGFDFRDPGDFLSARGGGIGQAIPTAIGMKLAAPARPVLAISGDGSAMYTIQALWTAARHDIPLVAVILNNGGYNILKEGLDYYRRRRGLQVDPNYPHLDITNPDIDFVGLAKGLGVNGVRIERPEDIAGAVSRAFDSKRPWLIDILVSERN